MFRSLATRLIALWVLAAVALVAIAVVAVTAISLSAFAFSENQAMDSVVSRAPDEARIAIARHATLAAAADDIARDLVRPGLRVAISGAAPGPPLAVAGFENDGVDLIHFGHHPDGRREPGRGPAPGPGAGGPFGPRTADALPYALNFFLRIEPRRVAVAGGTVAIFVDPHPLARTIDRFLWSMLPIGLLLIATAVVSGRYLSSLALRPLKETTAALRRFAAGDFTPRAIAASGRDEIGELVEAYNGAARQVAAAFEERRAVERQMRQFIGDAGHELRTPLTVIVGFVDVLRRRGTADATTTKIYDTMQAESRRMRTLIEKLILLARLENVQFAPQPELVDLGELAERAVATFAPLQAQPRIALDVAPGALAHVQESELYEAIQNLIENALKYAPLSPVDVRVGVEDGVAIVAVSDRGPGLTAEDREHAFDRFYRGSQRADKEGFGLGLAIVKRAVERAGGTIAIESDVGRGARFTIRLPLATSSTADIAGVPAGA